MPAKLTFAQRCIQIWPVLCGVLLFAATIILPLVILPVGDNFLIDSKTLFFLAISILVFSIWTVTTFTKKTIQFTFSAFLFPISLLLASALLSSFLNAIYPTNQLLGMGGVFIGVCLIVILAPSLIPEKWGKHFPFLFVLPAILLSLASAAELLHAGPSIGLNLLLGLGLPNSPLFSLSGSPLLTAEIILIALAGAVTLLFTSRKALKPFFALTTLVLVGGLAINFHVLAQQKLLSDALPPFGASWSVAADTLKSLKATLIGVGPENYQQTYLQSKPSWVNTTPVWNLQFNQASDLPLTLIVTQGIIGLAAWIWLAVIIVRQSRHAQRNSRSFAMMSLMVLIIEVLLPPNVVLLALQAFILVFWVVIEKNILQDVQVHAFTVKLIKAGTEVQKVPKHSQFLVYAVSGISAILIAVVTFWVGRYSVSQYYMFIASLGTAQNNGLKVYNSQSQAIAIYPYSDSYYRSFASTSLAVAQVLATNKNMSDATKQQIIGLIQQAVQEARVTLTIDPNNSMNWVVIARTYNNLSGVVQDADSLTMSAYTQALTLAPTDPTLNLELGEVYYRLAQYPQAVAQFEKTVQLKPDWANAYYNLANSYHQTKQLQQSYDAYQQTLLLLPSGDDYDKVKMEQDEVKKELDAQTAAAAQQQGGQAGQNAPAPQAPPQPAVQPQTVEPAPSPSPTAQPTDEAGNPMPSPTPQPSPTEEANPSVQPSP